MMQIIVPVYNALDVLKSCVDALIKHNSQDEVVFINDGSTDPEVAPYLESMCGQVDSWNVVTNENNLGFVQTANRGLQLSHGDSVLLNSDAIVSTGWLDGLKWAAGHVEKLGTATPWSNHAEICSIPNTLHQNPIPSDLDELAATLQKNHQATYPEIPTAVGFCMLVTQAAKRAVGYFDEQSFGHGYGEENDYSMRVSKAGLRNVLCDNVYVAHIGNQSFKELDMRPDAKTMERLLTKHPNYGALISDFIEKDSLASLRQSIIDKIGAF